VITTNVLQGVFLNGALVLSTDLPALNGFIYVIDKVSILISK